MAVQAVCLFGNNGKEKSYHHGEYYFDKAQQIVKPPPVKDIKKDIQKNNENLDKTRDKQTTRTEKLEVDESAKRTVDIGNIVKDKSTVTVPPLGSRPIMFKQQERANSEYFVDNPDVPPLE